MLAVWNFYASVTHRWQRHYIFQYDVQLFIHPLSVWCSLSDCCPSIHIYFVWRDISLLSGWISVKLATFILNGCHWCINCEKVLSLPSRTVQVVFTQCWRQPQSEVRQCGDHGTLLTASRQRNRCFAVKTGNNDDGDDDDRDGGDDGDW